MTRKLQKGWPWVGSAWVKSASSFLVFLIRQHYGIVEIKMVTVLIEQQPMVDCFESPKKPTSHRFRPRPKMLDCAYLSYLKRR